ncbi:MAG: hypothetical protein JWL59_3563 [Chthoniobacteraceae bacterium]|nr:hypothetical protein [Chthoniobacteraceae bacterium]
MNRLLLCLLSFVCASAALTAHGQIDVNLQIKRRNFIRYEPLLATVTITNLSGRDLKLEDADNQWFGFQINGIDGSLVAPNDPNYHLEALDLKVGESVKRTVNLNTLFSISEFGHYKIKATIYSAQYQKFFVSKSNTFGLNDGRLIWQQSVGVPDGQPNAGDTHVVSVLAFQSDEKEYLYARIEDREKSIIYCTHKLSYMVDSQPPQIQLDANNNLFVLQLLGPKSYVLTKIGINGEVLAQNSYSAPKAHPYMRRLADGKLQIVGARRDAIETAAAQVETPKLSDRPANLLK